MTTWALLAAYGLALWAISPRAGTAASFFGGTGAGDREVGPALLAGSVLVTWVFAKSITNAADLGARFGIVGGAAYAAYYLSIPVAGIVLGSIRRTTGAASLAGFLVGRFGRGAAGAFLLAILVRLYNEVWSNTIVVGTYFGEKGSATFYLAAVAFTAITLAYSLKGGLRSSIVTDAVQLALVAFLLALLAFAILPANSAVALAASGEWTLPGGVDLLLVALLQVFSYPFHDPVLTDRAFIAPVRTVRRSFGWAGAAGIALILAFSLIGVHAFLRGMEVADDAPRVVAAAFGVGVLVAMNLVMMTSAGSTLDSTFSALAKWVAIDVPTAAGRRPETEGRPHPLGARDPASPSVSRWSGSVTVGRAAMVAGALLGSIPLLSGATILQATTISGTMVLGLAPIVCLHRLGPAPKAAFHLPFWTGIGIGLALVAGVWPAALAIGDGAYANLLGANLWGLALATGLYLAAWGWGRLQGEARSNDLAREVPG
ncbi:MAG: sodium:solute symporter [Gemmatimonadota bacterium]|nr:sodium:solute symporter [Gemmatimonadota bacterium]